MNARLRTTQQSDPASKTDAERLEGLVNDLLIHLQRISVAAHTDEQLKGMAVGQFIAAEAIAAMERASR